MQTIQLESRPLYGIGTVARLTGLKPDTLRVWERRYGLGASSKSATGRRQYSQTDLEHLQMISALVESGARIGEIASSERKTLEMMLRSRGRRGSAALQVEKPRVVFVGEQLCRWLDGHQGCIARVDALLARVPAGREDLVESLVSQTIDTLVLEYPNLNTASLQQIGNLMERLQPQRVLVTFHFGNERAIEQLRKLQVTATQFPPEPAFVAYEMSRSIAEKAVNQGNGDAGELVVSKPRQFGEKELSAAAAMRGHVDCECPGHLTQLITTLTHFEEYSSNCSAENWQDAAVHSCIFAYTSQARWLMEKALQAVVDHHGEEFNQRLQEQD
jgi:hypothetical protein